MKRKTTHISSKEDAEITADALKDPDNPPLTDEEMSEMRPMREVLPQLCTPKKTPISIRIDDDVLSWFKSQAEKAGGSYQAMINQSLRLQMSGSSGDLESTLRRVLREELKTVRQKTESAA